MRFMNAAKRLMSGIMVCVAVLALLPAPAQAADTAIDSYNAYYEYLTEEINGLGTPIRDMDYYQMFTEKVPRDAKVEKLLAVHLIDVTGDGVEELILKRYVVNSAGTANDSRKNEWIAIYTYKNGEIVRIGQNGQWCQYYPEYKGWGYYSPVGYIGNILSSHAYPNSSDEKVTSFKGTDGKIYLADKTPSYGGAEVISTFYTYNGSTMAPAAKFEVNWVADWYYGGVHSDYGSTLYYVNDEKVTKSQYTSALNKYTGNGSAGYVWENNDYHTALNWLQQTVASYNSPSTWAADTVNAAIAQGIVPAQLQKGYREAITRAEFCALAVQFYEKVSGAAITERTEFVDTDDVNVEKMAGLGVVNGVGNDCFAPDSKLTREQAATILSRLAAAMDKPLADAKPDFADKGAISTWAYSQVGQVQAAGIMNGKENNKFDPQGEYTREQSILTIMRMF